MKQLIFRLISPEAQVYSVLYGEVSDGQFKLLDFESAPTTVAEYVVASQIFGSHGYIPKAVLAKFIKALGSDLDGLEMFPNFLVLNLVDNEKSEEENA